MRKKDGPNYHVECQKLMSIIYRDAKFDGCVWSGSPVSFVRKNQRILKIPQSAIPKKKNYEAYLRLLTPLAASCIEKKPAPPVRCHNGYKILKDYLATEEGIAKWRQVRFDALRKAGGRCCLCGATAASGAVLHVDHIKPKSIFPALAFESSNLQVLCADCNMGKGNRSQDDFSKI